MLKKYSCIVLLNISLYSTTAPNTVIGVVADPLHTLSRPWDAVVTPNDITAYITSQTANAVSIVDISTSTITGTVYDPDATLKGPISIVLTPNAATAYVSNSNNTVSYINVLTNTASRVTDPETTFKGPQGITVSADGTKVYVANAANNTVSVIDVTSNAVTSTIGSGFFHAPFAMATAGTKAYVGNSDTLYGLTIIDTLSNTVTGTVGISSFPNFGEITGLVVTPNGETIYVVNRYRNVYVVDAATDQVTGIVADPHSILLDKPFSGAITPDGTTVYFTLPLYNNLAIMDVATNTVTGSVLDPLSTFTSPLYIAITPDGSTGYIPNLYGESVSILYISPSVHVPGSVSACRNQNSFFLQKDVINKVTWSAPTSGTAPVNYNIYRDAGLTDLVATVPASGPLEYFDHNRRSNLWYSYYVVSVDQYGNEGAPLGTVAAQPC